MTTTTKVQFREGHLYNVEYSTPDFHIAAIQGTAREGLLPDTWIIAGIGRDEGCSVTMRNRCYMARHLYSCCDDGGETFSRGMSGVMP